MRRTDLFAVLAVIGAFGLFLVFYFSGNIGNLSTNLQGIVDIVVAGLVVAGGTLFFQPRIRDRSEHEGMIDDLQNPEVRLELFGKAKLHIAQLVESENAREILRSYPHVKTLIDGLTLMDEHQAEIARLELNVQISLDNMMAGHYRDYKMDPFKAETLGKSAIDLMTIRKDAKMLRKVEPDEKRTEAKRTKTEAIDWKETLK